MQKQVVSSSRRPACPTFTLHTGTMPAPRFWTMQRSSTKLPKDVPAASNFQNSAYNLPANGRALHLSAVKILSVYVSREDLSHWVAHTFYVCETYEFRKKVVHSLVNCMFRGFISVVYVLRISMVNVDCLLLIVCTYTFCVLYSPQVLFGCKCDLIIIMTRLRFLQAIYRPYC